MENNNVFRVTAVQEPPVFLDLEQSVEKARRLIAQASGGGARLIVFPETWLPLARQAMHAQQELVHVAQWPTVKEMHLIASRHYAFEGRCFVVAAGAVLQKRDLAHLDLPLLADIPGSDDTYLMRGGSAIISPEGDLLAGPLYEQPGLVSAEIDPQQAVDGRLTLDVMGHYGRPDIFQLHVNTTPQEHVYWQDSC